MNQDPPMPLSVKQLSEARYAGTDMFRLASYSYPLLSQLHMVDITRSALRIPLDQLFFTWLCSSIRSNGREQVLLQVSPKCTFLS